MYGSAIEVNGYFFVQMATKVNKLTLFKIL